MRLFLQYKIITFSLRSAGENSEEDAEPEAAEEEPEIEVDLKFVTNFEKSCEEAISLFIDSKIPLIFSVCIIILLVECSSIGFSCYLARIFKLSD